MPTKSQTQWKLKSGDVGNPETDGGLFACLCTAFEAACGGDARSLQKESSGRY